MIAEIILLVFGIITLALAIKDIKNGTGNRNVWTVWRMVFSFALGIICVFLGLAGLFIPDLLDNLIASLKR